MKFADYCPLARRTLKELPYHEHIVHMSLGLAGELGELLDAIKKHVVYGKPLDLVNLTEELGDSYWYAANLMPELRVALDVFSNAMRAGVLSGQERRAQIEREVAPENVMWIVSMELLHLNSGLGVAIARGLLHAQLLSNQPPESGGANASSMLSVQAVESIGGLLGTIGGLLGLNEEQAMDLNIDKLVKRYGDKYSDVAALNRDLDGERAVLEGKPALALVGGTTVETVEVVTESPVQPMGKLLDEEEARMADAAALSAPHDGTGTVE